MKLRIALLEASHWHVPLYIKALKSLDHKVTAISDADEKVAAELANSLNCTAYTSYRELIFKEKPDFVFAFGKHADMPEIAEFLLRGKVPFVIEKPVGIKSGQIKKLLSLQEDLGGFVSVPLVFRYSPLMNDITTVQQTGELREITHCYFRFIAGSPQRYIKANSAWMLDPVVAGGGCTINLSVHFIDLFLYFSKASIASVYAALSSVTHKTKIEDFSTVILKTNKNQIGIIETGYTYPENERALREIYYSINSDKGMMWIKDDILHWIGIGKRQEQIINTNTRMDVDHSTYVQKVLQEFLANTPPRTSLKEMYEIMKIIDAAYESDKRSEIIRM